MMITTCLRHALCLAHPKCAGRQQRGAAGMSSREYRSESRMRQPSPMPSPTNSSLARKAKSQRTAATETARRDRTAAPMPCTSLRSGLCCFHLARNENSVVNEVRALRSRASRVALRPPLSLSIPSHRSRFKSKKKTVPQIECGNGFEFDFERTRTHRPASPHPAPRGGGRRRRGARRGVAGSTSSPGWLGV